MHRYITMQLISYDRLLLVSSSSSSKAQQLRLSRFFVKHMHTIRKCIYTSNCAIISVPGGNVVTLYTASLALLDQFAHLLHPTAVRHSSFYTHAHTYIGDIS